MPGTTGDATTDGVLASEPALGLMGSNHEHVFIRGANNQVLQKWWNG